MAESPPRGNWTSAVLDVSVIIAHLKGPERERKEHVDAAGQVLAAFDAGLVEIYLPSITIAEIIYWEGEGPTARLPRRGTPKNSMTTSSSSTTSRSIDHLPAVPGSWSARLKRGTASTQSTWLRASSRPSTGSSRSTPRIYRLASISRSLSTRLTRRPSRGSWYLRSQART